MLMTFSVDAPFTSAGVPDTRPTTWGTTAEDPKPYQFMNVPAGQHVTITRVYGNLTAWVHGQVPMGTKAGVLLALQSTSATANPNLQNAAVGCFMYLNTCVGDQPTTVTFDFPKIQGGTLADDSILIIKRAIYLNETGTSGAEVHCEATICGEYYYS